MTFKFVSIRIESYLFIIRIKERLYFNKLLANQGISDRGFIILENAMTKNLNEYLVIIKWIRPRIKDLDTIEQILQNKESIVSIEKELISDFLSTPIK